MNPQENQLDQLLDLVAQHVDLDRCREIDDRYLASLTWQEVDRPPLVVQAPFTKALKFPDPWQTFRRYSYKEAFDNPVAMMQNQLLDYVVPGLVLGDDSPLAIRNNHGTIQIASLLGGNWMLHEDNYPWVNPFDSRASFQNIIDGPADIDLEVGVVPRSLETLRFYTEKLAEHTPCAAAIQIALPDLQGPLDTLDQLWGSDLFYAFYDEPVLVQKLLDRIVRAMLAAADRFRTYATDRLDPAANTQHGYEIPGRLLIRNDSAIMLSADMYAQQVRPHDARLLDEIGAGSIHFCGDGQHLIEPMLEIGSLRGLDFGQSDMMDIAAIYRACRDRRVAVTNIKPTRDDLITGKARRDHPTGAVFMYQTDNLDDAKQVIDTYVRC